MKFRVILAALVVWAAIAGAQPVLRLKTRLNPTSRDLSRAHAGTHYILQFHEYPDAGVRADLMERGLRILEYVPDNGLLVSGRTIQLRGLELASTQPVQAADKISPQLQTVATGPLLLEFYIDVDMTLAPSVLAGAGFDVVENPSLLRHQLVVTGPHSGIEALADRDEVKYILPAPPALAAGEAMVGCSGALTEAGAIGDYVLMSQGWPKDSAGNVALKYFIDSFPTVLDPSAARSEIDRALQEWTKYTNLTITPGTQQGATRSIDVLFARGVHGDAYPFDGPGGVLAHTFYPAPPNSEAIAGDIHLDADEMWKIGTSIDLYSVALHEAGHALGLGHSDQPGAVMYPYYKVATGLAGDDIAAIQALYGVQTSAPAPGPTPTPTPTPQPTPTPTPTPTPAPAPSGPDTAPPSVTILSPGLTISSTTQSSMAFSGTASDNGGVVSVKWANSTGDSGTASGTANWSATIPLLTGINVVTIRAYDAAGNSGWRAVTVVRH
jgi:hypothetical protein